jgi:hypothetical protein
MPPDADCPQMKLHLRSLLTIRLRPIGYFCLLLALALVYSPMALAAPQSGPKQSGAPHVDLRPKLVPGEVLVYQIQLQTITDTKPTGAISDPEGPSRLAVTWDATVKLEVLGELPQTPAAPPAPKPATGKVDGAQAARPPVPPPVPRAAPVPAPLATPLRIRTTYEHSAASVKGDSPDPQADEIEERYAQLDGRAIEFTVGTDGHVSEVHGLDNVFENDQVRQAAEQWMLQVSSPAMVPGGVAIGQSWNSAQPAVSMPLAEMVWRSNSTYLRNESCRPADTSAASKESCAVILTRQSVLPQKQLHDPTPDDYRRNGLHTAGTWTGSGESLSYVSLETHVAVSVTQDSSQQIDFTVTNSEGASIRYAGNIDTHSRVELLPPDCGGPR